MNEAEQRHLVAAEQRMQTLMVLINLGLRVLSAQVVLFFALLLDALIFAWAMYADSWPRIVGATLFSVASWCLIRLHPKGKPNE